MRYPDYYLSPIPIIIILALITFIYIEKMKKITEYRFCIYDTAKAIYQATFGLILNEFTFLILLYTLTTISVYIIVKNIFIIKDTADNSRCNLEPSDLTLSITAIAAIIAIHSLRSSKDSSKANFIINANNQYYTQPINDDMGVLYDFQERISKNFNPAIKFAKRYRTDSNNPYRQIDIEIDKDKGYIFTRKIQDKMETLKTLCIYAYPEYAGNNEKLAVLAGKLDSARRSIKGYFIDIHTLKEAGLSEETLKLAFNKNGLLAFFDIVEPLESIINSEYSFEPFFHTMRITKKLYREQAKSRTKGIE